MADRLNDEIAADVKDDLLVKPNFPGGPKLKPRLPTRIGAPETTKALETIYNTASDHGMIALRIPLADAKRIALPGGERAADLHVTLVYLGDVASIPSEHLDDLRRKLRAICEHVEPLEGRITGYGRFAPTDDEDVIWAGFDSADLPELRHQVLQACRDSAIEPAGDHGFTPHITLAYVEPGEGEDSMPPDLDVEIRGLSLVLGDQEIVIPFRGTGVEDDEHKPQPTLPTDTFSTLQQPAKTFGKMLDLDEWAADKGALLVRPDVLGVGCVVVKKGADVSVGIENWEAPVRLDDLVNALKRIPHDFIAVGRLSAYDPITAEWIDGERMAQVFTAERKGAAPIFLPADLLVLDGDLSGYPARERFERLRALMPIAGSHVLVPPQYEVRADQELDAAVEQAQEWAPAEREKTWSCPGVTVVQADSVYTHGVSEAEVRLALTTKQYAFGAGPGIPTERPGEFGADQKVKPNFLVPERKSLSAAEQKDLDDENEAIAENKKQYGETRHRYVAAKWTHPNGHPRCLKCGGEQTITNVCNDTEEHYEAALDKTEALAKYSEDQPRDDQGRWTEAGGSIAGHAFGHVTSTIQRAVRESPGRVTHGHTSKNAFAISKDGTDIIPWNELKGSRFSAQDATAEMTSVHSHAADAGVQDREAETFYTFSPPDVSGFLKVPAFRHDVVLMADGRMEVLTKKGDPNLYVALGKKPKKVETMLDAPYAERAAHYEAWKKANPGAADAEYYKNDLHRERLREFAKKYGLEYRVGTWKPKDVKKYSPDQPRDEEGKWTDAGGPMAGSKLDEGAKAAIANTPGAKITPHGIELDVSRHQNPEQAGAESVRTGVFFLPEHKSPWSRHYAGDKSGYGGSMKVMGRITVKNPFMVKASTGGNGPKLAYDAIEGKGAYEKMRSEALTPPVMTTSLYGGKPGGPDHEAAVAAFLTKYGGDPEMAGDIIRHSKGGNLLPYALQEHIVAHSLRKAGYDAILAYSKHKGQPHLAEVFDLSRRHYPQIEHPGKWEHVKSADGLVWVYEDASAAAGVFGTPGAAGIIAPQQGMFRKPQRKDWGTDFGGGYNAGIPLTMVPTRGRKKPRSSGPEDDGAWPSYGGKPAESQMFDKAAWETEDRDDRGRWTESGGISSVDIPEGMSTVGTKKAWKVRSGQTHAFVKIGPSQGWVKPGDSTKKIPALDQDVLYVGDVEAFKPSPRDTIRVLRMIQHLARQEKVPAIEANVINDHLGEVLKQLPGTQFGSAFRKGQPHRGFYRIPVPQDTAKDGGNVHGSGTGDGDSFSVGPGVVGGHRFVTGELRDGAFVNDPKHPRVNPYEAIFQRKGVWLGVKRITKDAYDRQMALKDLAAYEAAQRDRESMVGAILRSAGSDADPADVVADLEKYGLQEPDKKPRRFPEVGTDMGFNDTYDALAKAFDESEHPRDESGKWTESGSSGFTPKIYMRPEELQASEQPGMSQHRIGRNLIPSPMKDSEIPDTLYHVTTNLGAVNASGHLRGQSDGGGLGGGNNMAGVSFTTSKDDAEHIERALKREIGMAHLPVGDREAVKAALTSYAREDEQKAGLKPGALNDAIDFAMTNYDANAETRSHGWNDKDLKYNAPLSPEDREHRDRTGRHEAHAQYNQLRESRGIKLTVGEAGKLADWHAHPAYQWLKNPLILGSGDTFATMKPEDVGTLTVPKGQIPKGALVRPGSDDFLHEVRVHADVPLPKRTAKAEGKRTIAIDFDGTCTINADGTENPKMRTLVEALTEKGTPVAIFTARPADEVEDWLVEHGWPEIPVTNEKSPDFAVMLDDRGVAFEPGMLQDLPSLQAALTSFKTWWEKAAGPRVPSVSKTVDMVEDGVVVVRHTFYGDDLMTAKHMLDAHRKADASLDAALKAKPYQGVDIEAVEKAAIPGTDQHIEVLDAHGWTFHANDHDSVVYAEPDSLDEVRVWDSGHWIRYTVDQEFVEQGRDAASLDQELKRPVEKKGWTDEARAAALETRRRNAAMRGKPSKEPKRLTPEESAAVVNQEAADQYKVRMRDASRETIVGPDGQVYSGGSHWEMGSKILRDLGVKGDEEDLNVSDLWGKRGFVRARLDDGVLGVEFDHSNEKARANAGAVIAAHGKDNNIFIDHPYDNGKPTVAFPSNEPGYIARAKAYVESGGKVFEGGRVMKFDPDQPRDEEGKWTDTGASGTHPKADHPFTEHMTEKQRPVVEKYEAELLARNRGPRGGVGKERMVIIMSNGDVALDKEGKANHVPFSGREVERVATMGGCVGTHNHPADGGFSLSPNDINAARNMNLAEVRAVGTDATYSMKPLPGKTWPNPAVMMHVYNKHTNPLIAVWKKRSDEELAKLGPVDRTSKESVRAYNKAATEFNHKANWEIQHETWMKAAPELGLHYTRIMRKK